MIIGILYHTIKGKTVFEAFVLDCILGKPTLPVYCEELKDTRGPYITKDQCLARVYEIVREVPFYKPKMQPRGYRCDKFTPKTKKQRT